MARRKECGIYKITSPSGKCYIGSSAHMRKRFNEHRGYFQRGDHYNGKLRHAARKYGVDAMRFEVVLTCDRDVLRDLEQLTIDHIRPEYNIEKTVAKVLHDLWKDPAWREKNSKRCSEQNVARWKEPDAREKHVRRMGILHEERPELRVLAADRLRDRWKCDGFRERMAVHSGNVFRKLFSDPEYRQSHGKRQSAMMKERLECPEARARLGRIGKEVNKRPVYCITLDRYFPSIGEAALALGVSVSLIGKQFRGLKTRTGWQWRYLTNEELLERGYDPSKIRRDMPKPDRKPPSKTKAFKPVLCMELGYMFPSAKVAQEAFGLERSGAIVCAISKGGKALGYSWRYLEPKDVPAQFESREFSSLAHLRFDSRCRAIVCVESGARYPSPKAAVEALGLGPASHYGISDALRGKKCEAYGYHWKYADTEV